MNKAIARLSLILGLLLLATAVGCRGGDDSGSAQLAPTVRPLPSPVEYRQEPDGVSLADPAFDALPGATADYGRLGGAAYRIEVPDGWNGRLVLYHHGVQEFAPTAEVESPPIRAYLIRNGFAWGASSYSSTSVVTGRFADETAALWDLFARTYGTPARTYILGPSLGGAAIYIAAERYGDRYDGALAVCGFADLLQVQQFISDFFVAGAYAAGVTQAEFETAADMDALIDGRIIPALTDPERRGRFEDILVALRGGPRPFAREGLHLEEATNWWQARLLLAMDVAENMDRQYTFVGVDGVDAAAFNRDVIRLSANEETVRSLLPGNEFNGDLQMPLLTVHTTGDGRVPINQEGVLRQKVEAAGKADLLVQRAVQAPRHCGLTETEWQQGLEDLVGWVENGVEPEGEELGLDGFSTVGRRFTLAPRLGADAAGRVTGADQRLTITGAATLDGQPLNSGSVWVEVVDHAGLRQACSFPAEPIVDGRYQVTVAGEAEVNGCGAPGHQIRLVTWQEGQTLVSRLEDWPSDNSLELAADFSSEREAPSEEAVTIVVGSVLDASGGSLPPGTVVEAYVGDVLCAIGALPPVVMTSSSPDQYSLRIVGPDAVTGCGKDAVVTFRIDGQTVAQTVTNLLDNQKQRVDLVRE